MTSYNRVILAGNVGTDPEMRYTPSGVPVTSFRLAVGRFSSAAEGTEPKKETDWFTIVTWRKQAELANQYLSKGRRVLVEGRIQTRSWEGQDGQKRYATDIVASRVVFLDRAPGTAALPAEGEAPAEGGGEDIAPEDVPF